MLLKIRIPMHSRYYRSGAARLQKHLKWKVKINSQSFSGLNFKSSTFFTLKHRHRTQHCDSRYCWSCWGSSWGEGASGGGQDCGGAEEPRKGSPGNPPAGGEAAEWEPDLRGMDAGGFRHRPPALRPLHPLYISQLHYHHHYLGKFI